MRVWYGIFCGAVFAALVHCSSAQVPQRLQIPGAVVFQGGRAVPIRQQQRINSISTDFLPRPRRPIPQLREIRPVIEEEEEFPPAPSQSISSFDQEVNKLSIPAVKQEQDEEEQQTIRPSPLPFRPERPIPVTRDQVREKPISFSDQLPLSRPTQVGQLLRQEPRALPLARPIPRPVRPVVRQEIDDEEENIPRQPIRQKVRTNQYVNQQYRPAPRPKGEADEEELRRRKPVAQILRKYRTDNEDGSITWGFENDDGTFKEETIGIDCVISGKYGYTDPDGVKREFSYESGNKCDPNQKEELDDDELPPPPPPRPKKPVNVGKQQPQQFQPQIQYRPALAQY